MLYENNLKHKKSPLMAARYALSSLWSLEPSAWNRQERQLECKKEITVMLLQTSFSYILHMYSMPDLSRKEQFHELPDE